MTKAEITERVKKYLSAGVNPPTVWNESDTGVWLAIDLATAELAREVADDPQRRYLLVHQFSKLLTTNTVALATVDVGYELLADTIANGPVYDGANRVTYHQAKSLFDLRGWVPSGWSFYAIENDTLYLRAADTSFEDSAASLVGVTIKFSCVARPKNVDDWDDRLMEDLVVKTAALLLRKPISQTPNE